MTPRLLSSKSVTEENQRTFPLICSTRSPPPPFKVAKATVQQSFNVWCWLCSSCSMEKSPMVPNPDPKQYWNNWKNDMSLFSATNQERPYEQLLHNCLKVLPNRFNFDDDTKGFCPRFKSQNYKTWSFTPTERAERVLTCQIGCITTNSRLNRKYPV